MRYDVRRPDAAAGHDKVIFLTHPPDSLDDLALFICNDFHPLQLYPEREAVFRKVRGVRVNRLPQRRRRQST